MMAATDFAWPALILFGMVCALDHAVWPSLLLSQPLVVGTITGAVFGHFESGIAAGAVTQMLWMASQPVGGAAVAEAWLAGLASACSVPRDLSLGGSAWLDAPGLAAPAVLGVAAALLGQGLLSVQRALQQRLARRLEARLVVGDASQVERFHALGLLLHATRGALATLVVLLMAPPAAQWLVRAGLHAPAGRLALATCAVSLAACAPRKRRTFALGLGLAAGTALAVCL